MWMTTAVVVTFDNEEIILMKTSIKVLPLVVSILALSIAGAPAIAGKQVKPEKMTCEEFIALDEEVQPVVVYWLHGKSGEVEAIDVDEYVTPVAYVLTECHKEKQSSVLDKVKHYFKTHTKPADLDKMEDD